MLSYFFTSTKKGARWAHHIIECYDHQSVHHDLPRDHVYTKENMEEDLKTYLSEGKYYEVSVLSLILNDWEHDKRRFCHMIYD